VKERCAFEAFVSACRVLGEGQLSLTRFRHVTDTPSDLTGVRGARAHVLARAFARPDGIDRSIGVRGVAPFRSECLVVEAPAFASEPGVASRLASDPAFGAWPWVIVTHDTAIANDVTRFLWATFAHFVADSETHPAGTRAGRHDAEPTTVRGAGRRCGAQAGCKVLRHSRVKDCGRRFTRVEKQMIARGEGFGERALLVVARVIARAANPTRRGEVEHHHLTLPVSSRRKRE
jgi:hypothetical protein